MNDQRPTTGPRSVVCAHPDCDLTSDDVALFRLSPKGKGHKFIGACRGHFAELDAPWDDDAPMTPMQVAWVRAQRTELSGE